MYSIKIKCPHCARHVNQGIYRITEYTSREPAALNEINMHRGVTVRQVNESDTASAYSTALCPECYGPIMITFDCRLCDIKNIAKSSTDVQWVLQGLEPRNIKIYPEAKRPDDSPLYPEKIRQHFIELQEDIHMKRTPARIVVGCRSVLEVTLRNLGYEKGNLLSRIEQARLDGVLTESMKDWAHRIRIDGNEAVHELEANQAEAEEFVSFLRLLFEVAFVLPDRVRQSQR